LQIGPIDNVHIYLPNQFLNFPVIDVNDLVSFVINSGGAYKFFLEQIIIFQDRYVGLSQEREIYVFANQAGISDCGQEIALAQLPMVLALNGCGWSAGQFSISNVDLFITEFFPKNHLYDNNGRKHGAARFRECGSNSPQIVSTVGHSITLDGSYHPFLTHLGAEYLSVKGTFGWSDKILEAIRNLSTLP